MLSYRDPLTNNLWQAEYFAAELVGPGFKGLPRQIGRINFHELDPERFGLQAHVLEDYYPNLKVVHQAMIIPDRYLVSTPDGSKRGVAFWIDNRGSDPSASVTSEMGRSNVAPLNWEDPKLLRAAPWLEWQTVCEGGHRYNWSNGRGHGFKGPRALGFGQNYALDDGKDWLDGTPTDGYTMYDREKGKTAQSVFVPREYGIGTASQTLPPNAWTATYSILVYFPTRAMKDFADRLANISGLLTDDEARARYTQNNLRGVSRSYRSGNDPFEAFTPKGVATSMGLESAEESYRGAKGIEPNMEVAHGHEMTQHVIAPPQVAGLWQEEPAVLFVCWPMSELAAGSLFAPRAREGMKGFGWEK